MLFSADIADGNTYYVPHCLCFFVYIILFFVFEWWVCPHLLDHLPEEWVHYVPFCDTFFKMCPSGTLIHKGFAPFAQDLNTEGVLPFLFTPLVTLPPRWQPFVPPSYLSPVCILLEHISLLVFLAEFVFWTLFFYYLSLYFQGFSLLVDCHVLDLVLHWCWHSHVILACLSNSSCS